MGKAQSKRSVDITTETDKTIEEKITEKVEKIEDLDKNDVVNGEAALHEKSQSEKKYSDELEVNNDNPKEKSIGSEETGASGDNIKTSDVVNEDCVVAMSNDEASVADESTKKVKKEKVKKKWSFRSISFGKKDKQKPTKTEECTENVAAEQINTKETISESTSNQQNSSHNCDEEIIKEKPENNGSSEKESIETPKADENSSNNVMTSESVDKDMATVEEKIEVLKTTETSKLETNSEEENILTNSGEMSQSANNGAEIKNVTPATEAESVCTIVSTIITTDENNLTPIETSTKDDSDKNGEIEQIHHNGTNGETEQEIESPKVQQIEELDAKNLKDSTVAVDTTQDISVPCE